jgi:hypothetical protein
VEFGRGKREDDKRSKDEERWTAPSWKKRILRLHKGGTGILKMSRLAWARAPRTEWCAFSR